MKIKKKKDAQMNIFIKSRLRQRIEEFTYEKQIKTMIMSYNCGEKCPIDEFEKFRETFKLSNNADEGIDIYVIGLQEIDMKILSFVFPKSKRNSKFQKWELLFFQVFSPYSQYQCLMSERFGGLHLIIYSKRKIVSQISEIKVDRVACGHLNVTSNKGSLAVSFKLYDSTSMCYLLSHMIHGNSKSKKRNKQYARITKKSCFGKEEEKDFYQPNNHDIVFWFGDVNYRLDLTHTEVKRKLNDIDYLLKFDQLNKEKSQKKCFINYKEAPIKFLPTYKFKKEPGNLLYYTSYCKKRTPSYPDRILFKSINEDFFKINCTEYTSPQDYEFADHKPVIGTYECKVRCLLNDLYQNIYDEIANDYINNSTFKKDSKNMKKTNQNEEDFDSLTTPLNPQKSK